MAETSLTSWGTWCKLGGKGGIEDMSDRGVVFIIWSLFRAACWVLKRSLWNGVCQIGWGREGTSLTR